MKNMIGVRRHDSDVTWLDQIEPLYQKDTEASQCSQISNNIFQDSQNIFLDSEILLRAPQMQMIKSW